MTIEKRMEELQSFYGKDNVVCKIVDNTTLVRVKSAQLPVGCKPEKTDVLLTFPQQQDSPAKRYVKENVRLPNGNTPRNFNPTMVDGETWYDFSYGFQWNPQSDPMYQYVESALHRFAKTD
jgi:hypothetical protein